MNSNQSNKKLIARRYPKFSAIRSTKSGAWIVFTLGEVEILVSANYLEKVLATAKERKEVA